MAVAWGIIGGAIPGISGAVAMALALPFTFAMDATTALVMLAGVWAGANYGGSIPAILMRIPGTPASAACLMDGYELTRQGKAAKALGVSLVCGTIGGLVSIVVLIALVLPLGELVLQLRLARDFALALFALTLLAGLAEASFLKGLASGFFGLLLTTVGLDTLTGSLRFTFGRTELHDRDRRRRRDGRPLRHHRDVLPDRPPGREPRWSWPTAPTPRSRRCAELRELWPATLIGTIVGLIVGVMPGAGATGLLLRRVQRGAALVEAARSCSGRARWRAWPRPRPRTTRSRAGDLVPTLALGIPGSNSAAIMLAALILHGIQPGPFLLSKHPASSSTRSSPGCSSSTCS